MKFKLDKKFVKLGRSWGMIIPPWFLKILDINPETDEMTLTVQDNRIVIEKNKNYLCIENRKITA
ncbi:MAG: hypothetical protein ACLSA2_08825 [Candidatus Gastranaerophilaceae bacterium]